MHVRSHTSDLIRNMSLIIWDEFPNANVAVIESVDDLCRRINSCGRPFGGISFVGVGDFRQIAPVVKGQGSVATFLASVKSSSLWLRFRQLQ